MLEKWQQILFKDIFNSFKLSEIFGLQFSTTNSLSTSTLSLNQKFVHSSESDLKNVTAKPGPFNMNHDSTIKTKHKICAMDHRSTMNIRYL